MMTDRRSGCTRPVALNLERSGNRPMSSFPIARIAAAVIALVVLDGCADQLGHRPVTAAAYCQAAGSEMGIAQCQQYYARNHVEPPQPTEAQPTEAVQPVMDSQDRIALLSLFQQQNFQNQQLQLQQQQQMPWMRPTINCSSSRSGNYVSTTCN
jgi:hypothetical protein